MLGVRSLALASVVVSLACTSTGAPSDAKSAKAEPAKAEPAKTEPTKPTKIEPTKIEPTKIEPEPEPAKIEAPSDLVQLPFYWAQARDGEIELDAHDVSKTEYEAYGSLELDDSLVLERGDARIPARFAHGQSFVLMSEAGRVTAKVDRVTLVPSDGIELAVRLAPERPLAAKTGMLAFPSSKAPVDPKVRLPELVADGDPILAPLLDDVNAALAKAGFAKARASELRVHRVTLPNDVRFIVDIQVFDGQDPDEAETTPTGLALADAKGTIVEWIRSLDAELEAYEVELALDLEGDGIDELIYLASYHEGAFWQLLRHVPGEAGAAGKYESLEFGGSGL
ncbi:hypothetical protein ACNOYE_11590 [Nannocystaceae bacterium ST9]